MNTRSAVIPFVLAALSLAALPVQAQPAAATLPYETLFYAHDGLRLEAYLYRPEGPGPFPLVVYNHGSAPPGEERNEWPAGYVARLFVPKGYALLVPERRGYGKSEGAPFSEAIGRDRGPKFVSRQVDEAGDVNAAVEYVLKLPNASIDAARVVIMGWSFGGIVTTLAAGQSARYAAAIIQAPGALNWTRSEELRKALTASAAKFHFPVQCAVAENDATTESARAICAAAQSAGAKTDLKIYPPFDRGRQRPGSPPGHAIFGPSGVDVWQQDVLTFLAEVLKPK
jgi:carboxymethylenebutenolidase